MKILTYIILSLILSAVLYTLAWYAGAYYVDRYIKSYIAIQAQANIKFSTLPTYPSGFPGPYTITYSGTIITPMERVEIRNMKVKGWPVSGQNVSVIAQDGFNVQSSFLHTDFQDVSYFDMTFTIPYNLPPLWAKPYLQEWQDEGDAKLNITRLNLNWLGMGVSGAGIIELNTELQPEAKGELLVRDYKDFISRITMAYNLSPQQAGIILSLLASQENPETGEIKLPVSIRNSRLYLYSFPLSPVPRIKWPSLPEKAKIS